MIDDTRPGEPAINYELTGVPNPAGPGSDATGPAVVFTHGWLNDGEVWAATVAELGDAARCLSWDLRGHGKSGAAEPGRYGREHALADLDRMIEIAGAPAILVGHSLGGYLSLAYAIENPDRVAGLVLVAAGPGFRSDDSREQWNDSVRSMATKADIPEGMEVISMHVDAMVIDRLPEITAPTAVVVGERDKRFQASAAVFGKHLQVVHDAVVPDAGHMVHVKQPEPVAAAVRAIVETLP